MSDEPNIKLEVFMMKLQCLMGYKYTHGNDTKRGNNEVELAVEFVTTAGIDSVFLKALKKCLFIICLCQISQIFQPINHRLKVVAPYTWKLFTLTIPIHH